jgi:ubiquinone/menaquinone biosynthesis C-methylase UbiE
MKQSHVFDPRNIDVLEMEDRKVWQNPDEILKMVEIKPDFVAADLGCGSGFFTTPLAKKVKKVYGIDVQKEMLQFLIQKIQKLKIKNIELRLSKENDIPLENESIDLLISVNTLHEFDDKEKMIEEIKRVLKSYGKALIVDFEKKKTNFGPPVSIRVSKKQAISFFEKRGFILSKAQDLFNHYLLVFSKIMQSK